jgi:uncharacterized phage protein (TIGR02218 family)
MTFDTVESSQEKGRPFRGYQFVLGDTVWRYAATAQDYMDAEGRVWQAVAISDDGIKQTGEASSDVLTINAPFSIGPVQQHLMTPPAEAMQVTIHRSHIGSAGNGEMRVVYSGEVRQVNIAEVGKAQITCETLGASMQRDGLRLGWQRTCPYALYDPLTCKVDKTAFATALRILSIDGFDITADGWVSGGFFQWTDPVRGVELRGIEKHVGNTLRVFGMLDDLYVGLVMTAYPGCARNYSTCGGKFNNSLNYGGVPHMPGVSPFAGHPVF